MNDQMRPQIFGQSNFLLQSIEQGKFLRYAAAFFGAATTIAVFQDLLHSQINDYSFYLSESLLFKAVWLFFLPLLMLQRRLLSQTENKFLSNWMTAVVVPSVLHILLTPLSISLISLFFYSHTYSFPRTFAYTLAEDVYLLPLIYSAAVLLNRLVKRMPKIELPETIPTTAIFSIAEKSENEFITTTEPKLPEMIVVTHGRKRIRLATTDIFYITAETPYVAIHLAGKRFLHNESLKSMSGKLNKAQFVRVHKSTVVNLEKIVSCTSRLNGDYDLRLEDQTEIRLSRSYRQEFMRLFDARHTS